MDAFFLTLEEVLAIHDDQIARYGGARGVRDMNRLLSALAAPASTFEGRFLHRNIAEMAAAYLFHLVTNHPFVDGNKRTGAVAAVVFLALNGISFPAPEKEFEKVVLAVASGKLSEVAVVRFIRRYLGG